MIDAACVSMPPRVRHAVFVHGAGAWGGQWAIWRRVFEAEGWQVEAPDLQPIDAGLAATRLSDYRAQVAGWIAEWPCAVVVGASLGGLLAWAAAVDVPAEARPHALVLVNPLPPSPWAAALHDRSAPAEATQPKGEAVRPWASQGRFSSTVRALPGASFPDQVHAFRHWRDESAAVLQEARAGLVLPRPALPMRVITSRHDDDILSPVVTTMAEALGADLHRLPGTHLDPVMGVSAVEAARSALAWLDAREAASRFSSMTPD